MEDLCRGFRLSQFEVLNWGTFDQDVWKMSPNQENSLLTGNIGSGKSTLVDGLATLLVPTRKLAFNKAAGAQDKERSMESYYHGFYTSQQDEYGKARSVGLRKAQHYSVLLAQFDSDALQETVTLAQVFWLKPGENKVRRLFVVASEGFSISQEFSGFGSQINQLKKQLRKLATVQLFDTYPPYSQAFSKLLGLGTDGKALELFNQTISMKSVGSVTDFVRQNMLERADLEKQLQELERSYDDLKRLHDAVVAARRKAELLTPVSHYGDEAIKAGQEKEHVSQCRELTDAYMARIAVGLYQIRLDKRQLELQKLNIQLQKLEQEKRDLGQKIGQIKEEILNNGGGRLQQLEAEIGRLGQYRDDSHKLYHNYENLAQALQLSAELLPETFLHNLKQARELAEQTQTDIEQLDERHFLKKREQQDVQSQQQDIVAQFNALKQRKSNINLRQLNVRELLCQKLAIEEDRLPFVGELIQVKQDANMWQGAVERVLHNFALSLMVPDELYRAVSDFVEQTHLGTRLVYYRIKQPENYRPVSSDAESLLNKIEIKPDSEHYDWLHKELQLRFDYACCEDMATFRRCEKAISCNGQIKSGKFRHEKDDRHKLHDKSRYVLGWSNKEKIQLLEQQFSGLKQQITELGQRISQLKKERNTLDEKRINALKLADFNLTFAQINWPVFSQQIQALQQEKQDLEQASDLLRDLQVQLEKLQQQFEPTEEKLKRRYTEHGAKQQDIKNDQQSLAEKKQLFDTLTEAQLKQYFPSIDEVYRKYIDKPQLRINELNNLTSQLKTKLNERVQHLETKRGKKENQMVVAMGNFAHEFPNDVAELDKSPQALPEYQYMLKRLTEEDLPRHESRFKDMLNRDTIRSMALFRSYLDKQEEEIDARIRLINNALHELDYQSGTFIEIDRIASPDLEVRDFKQRLKQCVEYASDENLYSEEKFTRVKDLIEQMRNEPRWTQKVVDVRYWHLFNVVERYREDNSEKECYSDSGGKSGGQKEKLAYSILAAAILLQYGLVDHDYHMSSKAKRRFNLVVIDEAFARGSKDSTRFGLELFKKLGLQLLLVTPLQKLDVIEHYVKHVHFVDQKQNRSMLLNMTIKEYRERLQQHLQLKQYQALTKEV